MFLKMFQATYLLTKVSSYLFLNIEIVAQVLPHVNRRSILGSDNFFDSSTQWDSGGACGQHTQHLRENPPSC